METVVTTCGGCGVGVRVRSPEIARRRICPRCRTVVVVPAPEVGRTAAGGRSCSHKASYLISTAAVLFLGFGGAVLTAVLSTNGETVEAADPTPTVSGTRAERSTRSSESPVVPPPSSVEPTSWVAPLARGLRFGRSALPDARSRFGAANGLAGLAATGPLNLAAELEIGMLVLSGIGLDASPDELAADDPAPGARAEAAPVLTPPNFGVPSVEALKAACPRKGVRRFTVRDDEGRTVVARLHGHRDGKTVVLLPDGRLGIPSMVVPTDEPFVPISCDELARRVQTGPFADFQVAQTKHYVILHQSSKRFADHQGELLEALYARLLEAFRNHEVPVYETEFPLVAVIFRDERDFRAHRAVDSDVRAFYEIFSNRIFLFEKSEQDGVEPEISALLSTQAAAHEGTHQVLQNIGVQPRLAAWPLWLVEGLAEYCASPASSRHGEPTWNGLGQINSLHMATLRELDDPLSNSLREADGPAGGTARREGRPTVEAMIRQPRMTATDYALAWSLTHYLALKRGPEFTRFLTVMGQVPPLEPRTADDHVRDFRAAFGSDLARLDRTLDAYLRRLARHKGYDPLPFYAVMFEQTRPPGIVRRAAMVSQSPQSILKWIRALSGPEAGMTTWQALPHATRARAVLTTQEWLRNY